MHKKIKEISDLYDEFVRDLLRSGKLPAWDTGEGYYSSSETEDMIMLFQKIDWSKVRSFLDLGSGDGKLALMASLFTDSTGIEIDKELHNKAEEFRRKLRLKCTFICGNYMEHDISGYDLIFLNPDKPFYRGLEAKMKKELKGKLLVYSPVYHPQTLKKTKEFNINSRIIPQYENK
ncbi:hypothetical protein JW968_05920 [Candidatus Woesearchaeota archaeon]|nr:hypothetical protein [Candidatus Woesearchaeota archaeon]